MTKVEKKLKAMRENPKDDWKISDLKSLANHFDIAYRQPGTSHVTFVFKGGLCLTVPTRRPIKPIYIKKFMEILESLEGEKGI